MSTADGVVGGTTLEHSARNSLVFVVIVAGSGPVDRDGRANGAANTPYFDLAHALACRGIESFRFDKAGVGESQPTDRPGSHASLARQIRDLQSVLHELHTRYATRRIIVVAHSEGSLVVADQPSNGFVDGVILLSPPGPEIVNSFRHQLLSSGIDQNSIALSEHYFDMVIRGQRFFPELGLRGYFPINSQDYLQEIMSVRLDRSLMNSGFDVSIVRGDLDTIIPLAEFSNLATNIEPVSTVHIPDMDHNLNDRSGSISSLLVESIVKLSLEFKNE